jgi:GntR family transcriptional regulator
MNTATLSKAATPLFEQIKTSLRDAILSGELQPGQKLPSENELQKRFSVSRITIRQALASLQAEALVETFNGKGSYVTRPANTPRLGMITGFFDHMRSRGMSARGQTLSVRKSKAQAKLAALLCSSCRPARR